MGAFLAFLAFVAWLQGQVEGRPTDEQVRVAEARLATRQPLEQVRAEIAATAANVVQALGDRFDGNFVPGELIDGTETQKCMGDWVLRYGRAREIHLADRRMAAGERTDSRWGEVVEAAEQAAHRGGLRVDYRHDNAVRFVNLTDTGHIVVTWWGAHLSVTAGTDCLLPAQD